MPLVRSIEIPCPCCGHQNRYRLEPSEGSPLLEIVRCDPDAGGCDTAFAVEVTLRVEVSVSTCRLALPSTTVQDALQDITQMAEPEADIDF